MNSIAANLAIGLAGAAGGAAITWLFCRARYYALREIADELLTALHVARVHISPAATDASRRVHRAIAKAEEARS